MHVIPPTLPTLCIGRPSSRAQAMLSDLGLVDLVTMARQDSGHLRRFAQIFDSTQRMASEIETFADVEEALHHGYVAFGAGGFFGATLHGGCAPTSTLRSPSMPAFRARGVAHTRVSHMAHGYGHAHVRPWFDVPFVPCRYAGEKRRVMGPEFSLAAKITKTLRRSRRGTRHAHLIAGTCIPLAAACVLLRAHAAAQVLPRAAMPGACCVCNIWMSPRDALPLDASAGHGLLSPGYAGKLGDCSSNDAGSWAEHQLITGTPAKFIVSPEANRDRIFRTMLSQAAKGDKWFDRKSVAGSRATPGDSAGAEHLVTREDAMSLVEQLRAIATSVALSASTRLPNATHPDEPRRPLPYRRRHLRCLCHPPEICGARLAPLRHRHLRCQTTLHRPNAVAPLLVVAESCKEMQARLIGLTDRIKTAAQALP